MLAVQRVLRIFDSIEVIRKVGTAVIHLVLLLESDVAAPVADFNQTVELLDMDNRFGKLKANVCRGDSTGGLFVEGTINELGALLDGKLLDVATAWKLCIVGDISRGSLELSLLLLRDVGRWSINGKVEAQVLVIVLGNGRGKRSVGLQVIVGDSECLLSTRFERRWQSDTIVLDIARLHPLVFKLRRNQT
jgi:hypothetical protein